MTAEASLTTIGTLTGRCFMAQQEHDHENGTIEKLDIRIEYCVP